MWQFAGGKHCGVPHPHLSRFKRFKMNRKAHCRKEKGCFFNSRYLTYERPRFAEVSSQFKVHSLFFFFLLEMHISCLKTAPRPQEKLRSAAQYITGSMAADKKVQRHIILAEQRPRWHFDGRTPRRSLCRSPCSTGAVAAGEEVAVAALRWIIIQNQKKKKKNAGLLNAPRGTESIKCCVLWHCWGENPHLIIAVSRGCYMLTAGCHPGFHHLPLAFHFSHVQLGKERWNLNSLSHQNVATDWWAASASHSATAAASPSDPKDQLCICRKAAVRRAKSPPVEHLFEYMQRRGGGKSEHSTDFNCQLRLMSSEWLLKRSHTWGDKCPLTIHLCRDVVWREQRGSLSNTPFSVVQRRRLSSPLAVGFSLFFLLCVYPSRQANCFLCVCAGLFLVCVSK